MSERTYRFRKCEPIDSRYNPSLSVVQNLKLPPTLLSRFDLLYLILDVPRNIPIVVYETSRVLVLQRSHLNQSTTSVHTETSCGVHFSPYIISIRNSGKLVSLVSGYKDLRNMETARKSRFGNTRQLESLIRLSSTANSILTNRETKDVKEAIRLMNVATQRAATDPNWTDFHGCYHNRTVRPDRER